MKRICIAAIVELALVACNGHVADYSDLNPTPLPAGSGLPVPNTPAPPVADGGTYDAPQVKAPLAAQCTIAAKASAAGDLPLPAGVDGVLEYAGVSSGTDTNWAVLQIVVGTPCATATDAANCQSAIRALAPPPVPGEGAAGSCGAGQLPEFLLLTVGDTVIKITTGADVIARYGPVVSTAEAALVAQVERSTSPTCKDITQNGTDFDYPTDEVEHADGGIEYVGPPLPGCTGRMTDGAVIPHVAAGIGGWLGAVAALEHSAIEAFARMALELRTHGAPAALIARAVKARADETRHTHAMARQAARFGGVMPATAPSEMHVRGLEAIALENAIEGCVRETLGAVVAAHQAAHATDAELRAELVLIAREEAEHAQLSWDLATWVEARLDERARTRVEAARLAAMTKFSAELASDADEQARVPGLVAFAGLPTRAAAEQIAAVTRSALA